ncbi:hypothetical protein [Paraburkholderia strydomiana]|uniref:Uncharacterized protein n=1 Tax=Paraburkholderia strydomiana TaxID=1245417 RepID=A0ABW9C1I7_9BURK
MKRLYARFVLCLIGPALRLATRETEAAKSIGWALSKSGQLSIIRTPEQARALDAELTAAISDSLRRAMNSEWLSRKEADAALSRHEASSAKDSGETG